MFCLLSHKLLLLQVTTTTTAGKYCQSFFIIFYRCFSIFLKCRLKSHRYMIISSIQSTVRQIDFQNEILLNLTTDVLDTLYIYIYRSIVIKIYIVIIIHQSSGNVVSKCPSHRIQ